MALTKYLLLLALSGCLMGQRIDIARTSLTLPNENITFGEFTMIDANGDGHFLFVNHAFLSDLPSTEDEFLFVSDAAGNLTLAITEGETSPDGLGTLGTLSFTGELAPILGQEGDIALTNILQGTSDPKTVLAWDTNSGLRLVAREGKPYPDGSSDEFEDFLKPVSISQTGSVTLTAMRDEEIIFQEGIGQSLSTIRPFEITGGDILRQNRFVDATDSGELVLGALYRQPSPSLLTTGIFDIVGDNTLINRALRGESAPTSSASFDGVFGTIGTDFQLNAFRSIAFFSTINEETTFGNGVFFQQSSGAPKQTVIRENEILTGGALANQTATFVGESFGVLGDTTFLLADDETVYVSGPVIINPETSDRAALIRWTPNSSPEVLLVGDEILPDASPTVTLDEIALQDVSANGTVAFQALGSNSINYPYHYHPETGLTLLANLGDSHPSGTIILPVNLGPELDDNGDAIFTFTIQENNFIERVLTLFDAGISATVSPTTLPAPCITVTANTSTVSISEVPNGLSLQLQILDETNYQFIDFGSPVLSANSTATLPGPNPTTVPGALLRIAVAD
ncbi:MAG: DUF7453 family protein [Roseibacillus sp.]